MTIKIGDEYIIDQAVDHYVLETRYKTTHEKAKNPYTWKPTYHSTIEQCAKAIADKELRKVVDSGIVADFNKSVEKLAAAVVKTNEGGE